MATLKRQNANGEWEIIQTTGRNVEELYKHTINTDIHLSVLDKEDLKKISLHENNSQIHVTATEKNTWNNKSNFSGSYEDLTNKPKTFTPSEHKHVISDVTNLQYTLDSRSLINHKHVISDVTNLQTTLDNKADTVLVTTTTNGLMSSVDKSKLNNIETGANKIVVNNTLTSTSTTQPLSANQGKVLNDKFNTHENKTDIHVTSSEKDTWNNKSNFSGSYKDLTNKPSIPDVNHKHVISDVTNLQYTLDSRSLINHKHVISDVTNLQNTLDSKIGSNDISNHLNGLVKTDGTTPMSNVTIGTRKGFFGKNSFAQGLGVEASEYYSHAEGSGTIASGYASHAEGYYTEASGDYSHTEGNGTIASGEVSHAEGEESVASEYASHAEGSYTKASGYASHAEGTSTEASGDASHAQGHYAKASGYASHAQGYYTESKNNSSHSAGRYSNMTLSSETVYSSTADAFVIGNGTSSSSRSNAFRVKFNGSAYGKSAYNSTGADYAEYFEWLDGNLENEDRVGYFVTIDGEKIRKANSKDNYILGIISANPSVIGDSHQEEWYDKYVRDDWGRIQYHYVDVEYEELDENGEMAKVIKSEYQPKLNPSWLNEEEYIPREKRKEWSAVGMMGKLLVRDDGTCIVNGYCKPNDEGVATKSDDGYRVMKRISEKIIQVLVI